MAAPVTMMTAVRRSVDTMRFKAAAALHRAKHFADSAPPPSSLQHTGIVCAERTASKRAVARALRDAHAGLSRGLRPPSLSALPSQVPQAALENNPLFHKRPVAAATDWSATAPPRPAVADADAGCADSCTSTVAQWLRERTTQAKALFQTCAPEAGGSGSSSTTVAPPCQFVPKLRFRVPKHTFVRLSDGPSIVSALLQRTFRNPAPMLRTTVAARYLYTDPTATSPSCSSSTAGGGRPTAGLHVPMPPSRLAKVPRTPVLPTWQRTADDATATYRTVPVTASSWDDWCMMAPVPASRSPPVSPHHPSPTASLATPPSPPPSLRTPYTGRKETLLTDAARTAPSSLASRARHVPAAAAEGPLVAVRTPQAVPSLSVAAAKSPSDATTMLADTGRANCAGHGGHGAAPRQARGRNTLRGNSQASFQDTTRVSFATFRASRSPVEGAAPARESRRSMPAQAPRRHMSTTVAGPSKAVAHGNAPQGRRHAVTCVASEA